MIVIQRPASWWELIEAFMLGALTSLVLLYPTPVWAGGPVVVTWDQAADCASVTGWELLVAPVTTVNPNPLPSAATLGATIANTGTPACGMAMVKTATITSGVGPQRFWIRAVGGAIKSVESNSVDASLSFTAPGLRSVTP